MFGLAGPLVVISRLILRANTLLGRTTATMEFFHTEAEARAYLDKCRARDAAKGGGAQASKVT